MNTRLAAVLAVLLMSGSAANAVTLDFIGYIDNVSGETAGDDLVMNDGTYVPIKTTARGYSGDAVSGKTGSSYHAYGDYREAGLGVCKVKLAPQAAFGANECSPSSDDNLTSGEILGLSWAVDIVLNKIGFRGEGHPSDPPFDVTDLFDISFDGGVSWVLGETLINQKDGLYDAGGIHVSAGTEVLFAYKNEQYYVSSMEVDIVPLPAGVLLLLTGMGGLALARRRRGVD